MEKKLLFLSVVFTTFFSFKNSNCQNLFYFKNEPINIGFIREQLELKKSILHNYKTFSYGYKGIIELGYQNNIRSWDYETLKLNVINGYQIFSSSSFGLGTGLRYYIEKKSFLIPVFSDMRLNLSSKKNSPVLSLGIGYSFLAKNNLKGAGVHFNSTASFNLKLSDNYYVSFGIGYELQRMRSTSYVYYLPYPYIVSNKFFGSMSINVGFLLQKTKTSP